MIPGTSIIICTRNQAAGLSHALASIGKCDIPTCLPAELLIVDNGSTDETKQVVEQAGLSNVVVRYLREPRPGQCHARNLGLAEGRGSVFLFTDDDVRVPRNWVVSMCRPIIEGMADAIAGGVTLPAHLRCAFAREPLRSRRGWFASTDELDPILPNRMVGANMAFSRAAQQAVGPFDVELGPRALGFHDETLFSCQVVGSGFRLAGRLDVVVEHHFDPSRLNRAQLLSIAERMGASDAYLAWHWHHVTDIPSEQMRQEVRQRLLRERAQRQASVSSDQVEEWEIQSVHKIAYFEQLARESLRPRKYCRSQNQNPTLTIS